jgi:hypothetical protein
LPLKRGLMQTMYCTLPGQLTHSARPRRYV